MNMMASLPPPKFIGPDDIARLLDLIAVLANPEASKALLAQLTALRDEIHAKADALELRAAQIEIDEREHNAKLERERQDHTSALATAQTTFDKVCAEREKDLQFREAAAHEVKREAEKLMKEATALKADLERRRDIIRKAAS